MRPRNLARQKLDKGQPVFGCFLRYPDAGFAEFLALQGLDFIVFDGEHGTLAPYTCEHLVRATQLHGVTPIVRVEENRASSILRYLDAGALGCHVPGVESQDDAVSAVRAVKFRPQGNRGLSGSRPSGYRADEGFASHVANANRETQVIVHIESAAGVRAVKQIASVEGVDVLFVGMLDLSQDLGCPGELYEPEVLAAAEAVAAAARTSGKVLGAMASDPPQIRAWLDRGARYVVTTAESLVTPGVERFLAAAEQGPATGEREEEQC